MNTIFATIVSPLRRAVLTLLLAAILVSIMLTGTSHTAQAYSTSCISLITGVSAFNTSNNQTVYISGQCLGTRALPIRSDDSPNLLIHAYSTQIIDGWNACYTGDTVTCTISSWTNNQIVFKGFSGQFGKYPFTLTVGEPLAIQERSPQNPSQWSTCTVNVGRTTNCNTL